jgi:hypothetical protein
MSNHRVTLRFHVQSVTESAGGSHSTILVPSYKDGANKEWAKFTPAGRIELNLSQEAAVDFYTTAMREKRTVGITMEYVEDE